jgi:hypothetical protein
MRVANPRYRFYSIDVMRDFKKIHFQENYSNDYREEPESRREWMAYFEKACAHLKRDQSYSMFRQFTFRPG